MLKRSTIIVSFVLLTFFVVGGVELFCRLLDNALVLDTAKNIAQTGEKGEAAGRRNSSPQTRKSNVKAKTENYAIITKRGLFGKIISKETVKKEEPPVVLKATSMDLILLGTVTGKLNQQMAIIKDKKKKTQDIYYKGDAIGAALVKEVRRGKVILTVSGKDEILIMEELKSPSGGNASNSPVKSRKYGRPKKKTAKVIREQESFPGLDEEILGGDDPEAFFEPPPYIPPIEPTDNEDQQTPQAAFSRRKMVFKKSKVID